MTPITAATATRPAFRGMLVGMRRLAHGALLIGRDYSADCAKPVFRRIAPARYFFGNSRPISR